LPEATLQQLTEDERQQQDSHHLEQAVRVKSGPRPAAQQREQRSGDENASNIEQRRRHHRTRHTPPSQRRIGRRRLDRRWQAAEIQEAEREQRRHPA
jgi:hypothetical protein